MSEEGIKTTGHSVWRVLRLQLASVTQHWGLLVHSSAEANIRQLCG